MKTITREELETLCKNGRAIEQKSGYPAVVLHPDGTVTKFWARKKKLFSSATISPYSNRFIKNSENLAQRGIAAPKILDHAKLEHSHVRIVPYQSLPGISIRELIHTRPKTVDIPNLCRFFLELHKKGIYYRTIHLGNIIQLPNSGYGLIDFTDIKFYSKPLSLTKRAANIAVPIRKRYIEDVQAMNEAQLPNIPETYMDLLHLSPQEKNNFSLK